MALTLHDFDYQLENRFIAKAPTSPRDAAKLLVFHRQANTLIHSRFSDLATHLIPGDVLVLNQTKVFPARLLGNKPSGGKIELLLLKQLTTNTWEALVKPGLKVGTKMVFPETMTGVVCALQTTGEIVVAFSIAGAEFWTYLSTYGLTPLPPYIETHALESRIRLQYQTVYAKDTGSAAAPTAGMHFTKQLLLQIKQMGVSIEYVTLHVGLGTFQRLRQETVQDNRLHEEAFYISDKTQEVLKKAKTEKRRIIAVGTTTARALESMTTTGWQITQAFFYPPHRFTVIDGLITNFHLPQSSLLMLVAAFCSQPNTKHQFTTFSNSPIGMVYETAKRENYRFFSFGDAMFIAG